MNLNESCKKNLDKEYILFSLEFSILLISLDKKKVKLIKLPVHSKNPLLILVNTILLIYKY